jgi:hypothetical protein
LFSQELCEVATGVFFTMVRPKSLDLNVMLCLSPCGICLISLKNLILAFEELKTGVVREVVSEHYVVCASTN